MSDDEISETFAKWNDGELSSFLIEITATVLRKKGDETNKPLVEMILDTAGQKGTGKWTSQAAMDFGVPVPTIDSAVSMRQISSQKALRGSISRKFEKDLTNHHTILSDTDLESALQSLADAAQHAQSAGAQQPDVEPAEASSNEPKQAKGKVVDAEVVD